MRGDWDWARGVAALGALLGAGGLILQFAVLFRNLSADGASAIEVVWRFLGFFTILTNVLVAFIMAGAALRPGSRAGLNSPLMEAIGAAGILLVGGAYHILLAALWDPEGAQLIADILLHTATPIVFALFWVLRPHGGLTYRDAALCMIWPLSYSVYALARGAFDGWYAYWFFDPTQASWAQIALTTAAIMALFYLGSLALVALDRALARRAARSLGSAAERT